MLLEATSLALVLISVAIVRATAGVGLLEELLERQNAEANKSKASTSSATASSASSALSSSAPSSRMSNGLVSGDTVGTYSCSLVGEGTASPELVYSPDQVPGAECAEALPPVYPYNSLRIRSPDDSLRMNFLPYGATVSEIWVKDRNNAWQDIILGFDNKTNYGTDEAHNFFGPIVGRYANRIKNGTFELDGKTYHTPLNEKNHDTLHGGKVGYDRESWKISNINDSSITFTHHDPAGNQGFPNEVNTTATYTLLANATWKIRVNSRASGKTPIMLSSHVYWNLNPQSFNESQPILEHVLHMPYASKYVKTDTILIPTGELPAVENTGYDFREAKALKQNFEQTEGYCGYKCKGWDSCWIEPKGHPREKPSFEVYSPGSGIKLSVSTNQEAWQIYTTAGLDNPSAKPSIPRKRAHGGDGTLEKVYENYSAMVIEAEDFIDAINNPLWGRNQIYDQNRPYSWQAEYRFSKVDQNGKAL